MKDYLLQIAVPGPFPDGLTYLYSGEEDLNLIGRRVWVPLRQRQALGIVAAIVNHAEVGRDKLKHIICVIDDAPIISQQLASLILFMRNYYHVSLGDAYHTALPPLMCAGKPLQGRTLKSRKKSEDHFVRESIILNAEQEAVYDNIAKTGLEHFAIHLLDGVTGSGKTEVYLKCVENVLERNGAVLILVPEIGLAPQTVSRFEKRLGQAIAAFHSGLSEAQKRDCWVKVMQGEIKIVIGTRSAVFLPFARLQLIIVDEEHDSSYKQQSGVHYSAKSIALMRARQQNCPIILGSATPSVESYYFARQNLYQHHHLKQRAKTSKKNITKIVDMRKFKSISGFSKPFLETMRAHLERGQQVLIFLNRRGYAPVLFCAACRTQAKCPACEMSYTVHNHPSMLLCHHCGRMTKMYRECKDCQIEMQLLGQGTQQLEAFLSEYFSEYPLLRLDQDAVRKQGEFEQKLEKIKTGEAKIIIGTQMLAKGHDFPEITWVGIVDLDYGFFTPDFRGIERMGQLLLQVSGRAGRGEKQGEVMIQTHVPDHPLLQCLLKEDYSVFIEQLLEERKIAAWPPFQHLALLRAEAKNQNELHAQLNRIKSEILQKYSIGVLGPAPATLKKKNNYYRAQILLESVQRDELHRALNYLEARKSDSHQVRLYLDVDPIEVI